MIDKLSNVLSRLQKKSGNVDFTMFLMIYDENCSQLKFGGCLILLLLQCVLLILYVVRKNRMYWKT